MSECPKQHTEQPGENSRTSVIPSILRSSRSAPSLTALNDNCCRHGGDDGALKRPAVIEQMPEVYEVPLRSDDQIQSSMHRAVSFSTFTSIHRIHSREDLLDFKKDMWFGSKDISMFAQDELSRRRDLGITSTGMLCSSVPYDDDEEEEEEEEDYTHFDENMDFEFTSPAQLPPRG
jgi:hypothetical protein